MTPLSKQQLWERFQKRYTEFPALGLAVDLSRMNFGDDYFEKMAPHLQKAFADMADLEKGGIANPDENRMVGHYWLRHPALAPIPHIANEIKQTVESVKRFAAQVHSGELRGAKGAFKHILLIGIGGSALGPQFVSSALGDPKLDKMGLHFFDNTDPDGMDRVLARLQGELGKTLCVVISKSGGTKETRNGMLEAEFAYEREGLKFGAHAVAVTGEGSELDRFAATNGWIARFPMWDWVGGRTSELSAVGLLPAALQGLDVDQMLAGAKACDEVTRQPSAKSNPAAQLALAWFYAGNGKGEKDMVVLPYKDRLELFSKYLQQLVMESLGKALDLDGKRVNQGMSVFGNKGSTDQHAYVQQLRDGVLNFFVLFIEVLRGRNGKSTPVDPGITSANYLNGFLLGTRQALYENGRESITLTIQEVNPFALGVLIALFERAVGFYATLIHVNAYHQPGVEAGKKAAGSVLEIQQKTLSFLGAKRGQPCNVNQIANGIGEPSEAETIFKICQHLTSNPDHGVAKARGQSPFDANYRKS
jgi:glucose-6-phosphate isomerase